MSFWEFLILWVVFNFAVYGFIQVVKLVFKKIKGLVNRYLDYEMPIEDPTPAEASN